MITMVKRAPFAMFLCIGFPLGDLGCIGYWNSVGIHLTNSTWFQSRCQERPLAQGSELLSSITKCFLD